MDHPLCTERDHALLCCIVSEAGAIANETGARVTRRVVMTAFCYAKICGVPTDRRFMIYPAGPVADELLTDLEALEMDEAIKDVSLEPEHHANYITGVGALSLCAPHRGFLDLQRPRVQRVLKALAPLTKARLEQVACMHFLFLHLRKESAENLTQRVLAEFLAAREGEGWRISPEEAGDLYDRMAAAGLVTY